jgi:Na+/H+ antiporter NhaD/arsenite permease-like protein
MREQSSAVVMLSGRRFFFACAMIAAIVLFIGRFVPLSISLLAAEVFATILGLFFFGSFRYQVHKNALTYGMVLIFIATFCGLSSSVWHVEIAERGWQGWAQEHLFSFHGLDDLIHADTMLFILGLTFFVAVIAQTRLLEGLTFFLLRRFRGAVLPTALSVTAVVAFASGILDGVSMIGLTIRTLLIIMLLAAAPTAAVRYAVMVCTVVTTVCGIWLAYGEPPNLIMKANLEPHIDNAFFLRYCAPVAVASYLVIGLQLRRRLRGEHVNLETMDVIDANAEDVRFLQAMRHGEVLTPIEFVENHAGELGDRTDHVVARLREGESVGVSLVREEVPKATREQLLGRFVSEELAESLDRHYVLREAGDQAGALAAERQVDDTLAASARRRKVAQRFGALALIPFIGMLVWHGLDHRVPLFLASFAGFIVALLGIAKIPKMRALSLREASHEYAEYFFLFPLFLSITLLTKAGFFDQIQNVIRHGTESLGPSHVAFGQFVGSSLLSAILDNNVVADFASRALHGLPIDLMHLFAMAQIAGYALGGCWTHIGSAQSVVAYAFIRRDIDEDYTPVEWIKEISPIILQLLLLITVLIYLEGALYSRLS